MSLDTPINSITKLTQLLNEAESLYQLSLKAVRVTTDEETGEVIDVYIPKDARFWFDQMRRISTELTKLSTLTQITTVDQKINLIKTLIGGAKTLPQEMREQIARQLLPETKR